MIFTKNIREFVIQDINNMDMSGGAEKIAEIDKWEPSKAISP
jgi:hypothetical protein